MITLKDIQDYKNELFITVKSPNDLMGIFLEYSKWLIENYDKMDINAKEHTDTIFKGCSAMIGSAISKMPDSIEKRRYHRKHMMGDGEHASVEHLLDKLESKPDRISDLTLEATKIALDTIQNITDFLLDIVKRIHSGYPNIICLSMLYGCVDELLASIHLARHHFYVQAYTHLRTVLEVIDIVTLFTKEPEWIDLWEKGDFKARWKELSPSKVKKKLGHEKDDELYSFLSEHGTHATFRVLQARTALKVSDEPRRTFKIWYAGVPVEHHEVWFYNCALDIAIRVLLKVISFGEELLLEDEVCEVLDERAKNYKDFTEKYFLVWLKENGLDIESFKNFLEKWDGKIKDI